MHIASGGRAFRLGAVVSPTWGVIGYDRQPFERDICGAVERWFSTTATELVGFRTPLLTGRLGERVAGSVPGQADGRIERSALTISVKALPSPASTFTGHWPSVRPRE